MLGGLDDTDFTVIESDFLVVRNLAGDRLLLNK